MAGKHGRQMDEKKEACNEKSAELSRLHLLIPTVVGSSAQLRVLFRHAYS